MAKREKNQPSKTIGENCLCMAFRKKYIKDDSKLQMDEPKLFRMWVEALKTRIKQDLNTLCFPTLGATYYATYSIAV